MKRRVMMMLASMLSILLISEMQVTSVFAAEDGDFIDLEVTEVQEETSKTIVTGTYGDNLEWVYEDGVLTISGSGDMIDVSKYQSKEIWAMWKGISSEVTKVIIESGVTSIGRLAFSKWRAGFKLLSEIEIADTVKVIDDEAFKSSSIKSIDIPESVVEIGEEAFYDCKELTEITIPASVKTMYGYLDTFAGCSIDITFLGDCPYPGMAWCGINKGVGINATVTYSAENKTWDSVTYRGHHVEMDDDFGAGDKIQVDITWRPLRKDGLLQNSWEQELTCADVSVGQTPSPEASAYYGTVKFKYSKTKNGSYGSKPYTTKGTYYVKAVVSGTNEYTSLTSNAESYTVYDTPQMEVSRLVRGFKLSWTPAAGANLYYLYRWDVVREDWHFIARFDDRDLSDEGWYTYTDKLNMVSGTIYKYKFLTYSGENRTFRNKTRVENEIPRISIMYYRPPVISDVKNTSAGISITWKKVGGINQYRVYRKTVGGKWKGLATIGDTSYTDKTAKKGTTYIYAVRCMSEDGKTQLSQYRSTEKITRK